MSSYHKSKETLHQGKFLKLNLIKYHQDKERLWESVDRTTRNGDVDAVEIIAKIVEKGKEDLYIFVLQYRPPTEKYVLEFPAGLIDKNETAEECAIRELKEETGYLGKVVKESPVLVYEPGITSANCKVIEIECLKEENEKVVQKLDEEESIQVILLSKKELKKAIEKYSKEGVLIDAKVYLFSQ